MFDFVEENLGRVNFGNLIEGILKFNFFDIDFIVLKIMKFVILIIIVVNRMVLRFMKKLLEWLLKVLII